MERTKEKRELQLLPSNEPGAPRSRKKFAGAYWLQFVSFGRSRGASVQKALVMSSLFPGRIRFGESRSQAETLKRKKGEKKLGETVEFVIEIANLKSMPD